MATTQKKLDVTELDFDRIKSNLKTFMKNQTEFTDYDFEGSGLNALLDVLSYNTHYLAMNMNMVANESFLDTASTRSAVVSHAKTLGYIPNSPRAPVAFINVTLNNSTTDSSAFEELNTATIPIGTVFTTQMDDVNYQFVTVSEHTINKVDDVLSFTNIPIYEGTYVTNRYTVNNQNVDQKFYLADRNGDTSTLVVDVFDSATSTSSTTFTLATDTTLTSSTSNVFFLQESVDGKFEIYFGDGITGRAVSDGNIVRLRYVVTNKTLANGATSFSTTAAVSGITNVTVATISNASGGAESESIQSIKFNAPLDYAAQGRAVTVNDFKAIVPKVYANTKSVQVYGGEDNDVPTFGKVYISIVPTTGSITAAAKAQIVKDLKTTYTIASVSPEVVDPEYTKLRLNVTFTYNSKNTIKPKETLESNVLTTITNFNNKLYNPHSGHDSEAGGILSSTGFKIDGNINEMFLNDDGMGNVRMFYITDGTTNTYEDNTVGTIDYFNGSITLTNLKITEVSNVDGTTSTKVRLIVKPESSDIIAVRNQVLEIDLNNSVVTAAVDTIATGSSSAGVGVATTSIYSGASNTAASSTTSTTTSSSTSTSSSGSSSSSGY